MELEMNTKTSPWWISYFLVFLNKYYQRPLFFHCISYSSDLALVLPRSTIALCKKWNKTTEYMYWNVFIVMENEVGHMWQCQSEL